LERHINQLSASGAQQDLSGNFGVGAKISTAPANPLGVVYRSWKDGQGHQVWLHRDSRDQYGLRQFSLGAVEYCAKDLAGYADAKDMAATTARAWYEQALLETVIGIRALRNRKDWSDRDVDNALSPEALTAAVMQRYHIATSTTHDLHRKFHTTMLP